MRAASVSLLLVALLAGCLRGGMPKSHDPPPDAFDVALSPAHPEVGANETITLNLTLRAVRDVTVDHPCNGVGGWLSAIVDGVDKRIGLYPYGEPIGSCPAAVKTMHLEAGIVEEMTVHWNGHAGANQPQPHTGERVPPGTHEVAAFVRGVGEVDRFPVTVLPHEPA